VSSPIHTTEYAIAEHREIRFERQSHGYARGGDYAPHSRWPVSPARDGLLLGCRPERGDARPCRLCGAREWERNLRVSHTASKSEESASSFAHETAKVAGGHRVTRLRDSRIVPVADYTEGGTTLVINRGEGVRMGHGSAQRAILEQTTGEVRSRKHSPYEQPDPHHRFGFTIHAIDCRRVRDGRRVFRDSFAEPEPSSGFANGTDGHHPERRTQLGGYGDQNSAADPAIFESLGTRICYGMQLIAHIEGGQVIPQPTAAEYGSRREESPGDQGDVRRLLHE